ncbi:MAG: 30S ribosomal protein S11 [bacterium]
MAKTTKKNDSKKVVKKKSKSLILSGSIYVQSSFNNTIISITDEKGGVISWASAGSLGFKGAKKSTPYAAQLATAQALEKAKARGFAKANIYVSGVGSGRDSAVRALTNSSIEVSVIKDTTPIAHNGCRPKKPRRV